MNIRDYLKNHILVTDGAMGTYYSEMYQRETRLVEQAVLNHPGRIQKIHEQYLLAGARLLRTDSFAVNASFFPEEMFEKFFEQIVENFYRQGFKTIIIINGHGGKARACKEALGFALHLHGQFARGHQHQGLHGVAFC